MYKIKGYIFSDSIEDGALNQFYSAMEQDYVVKGALMPDAHKGYGLPIGGVVATKGVIVPSWVGYDIGCGMCAIKTSFNIDDIKKNVNSIYNDIIDTIPVGFNKRNIPVCKDVIEDVERKLSDDLCNILQEKNALHALGTLGGGNHFLEIGYGRDNSIWIIIHSGSRGPGHGCATHYMKLAGGGKAREGHYPLNVDSIEGKNYIKDLDFMLGYALLNRMYMIKDVVKILKKYSNGGVHWGDIINRNHNHAECKDGIWIHRKGATHADAGMFGVIPGNMRDGSFIVKGKGSELSLCSSSHGAGRVLSRNIAKKTLNVDDFTDTMKGIKCNASKNTLDESPFAYKDIFEVMNDQKDLVEVIDYIKPIINVKG